MGDSKMIALRRRQLWAVLLAAGLVCATVQAFAQTDAAADEVPLPTPQPELPQNSDNRLARGYSVPGTRARIGGYGEVSFIDENDNAERWRATLDSISLLLNWDDGARWRFFTEVELEDSVILSPGDSTTDEAYVSLERLHVDYTQSDFLQLRVGKYLTPIGRWNLIHAAPLVWTTSRPLITDSTFPTNATGAMVFGVVPLFHRAIDYSIYGSIGEELFPNPELDTFKEAYGIRLNYSFDVHTQVGTSFASFEQELTPDERKEMFGIDFVWKYHRWELQGEWVYRRLQQAAERADERGYYVQLVAPLSERLYAVARTEYLNKVDFDRGVHLQIGGLTWRYSPAWVFKAEYRYAVENDIGVDEGLLTSFAVLF